MCVGSLGPVVRVVVLAAGGLAADLPASAQSWEITGHAGRAFPFREETVTHDTGDLDPPYAGSAIVPITPFRVTGRGQLTFGGGITGWFGRHGHLGLELRIDTADAVVDTVGARYAITIPATATTPDPEGGDPVTRPVFLRAEADVGPGSIDLTRLKPVSLNLRVRFGDDVRFTASGGVSYLTEIRAAASQPVSLRVQPVPEGTDPVVLAALTAPGGRLGVEGVPVTLATQGEPQAGEGGKLGANLGLGLQVRVARHVALVAEGRAFVFRRESVRLTALTTGGLPPVAENVVRQVADRVDSIDFTPVGFLASVGLALQF